MLSSVARAPHAGSDRYWMKPGVSPTPYPGISAHGRIIERGTHEQLLVLGGKYARLCEQSLLETSDSTIA